jgi:hypothetical protein
LSIDPPAWEGLKGDTDTSDHPWGDQGLFPAEDSGSLSGDREEESDEPGSSSSGHNVIGRRVNWTGQSQTFERGPATQYSDATNLLILKFSRAVLGN